MEIDNYVRKEIARLEREQQEASRKEGEERAKEDYLVRSLEQNWLRAERKIQQILAGSPTLWDHLVSRDFFIVHGTDVCIAFYHVPQTLRTFPFHYEIAISMMAGRGPEGKGEIEILIREAGPGRRNGPYSFRLRRPQSKPTALAKNIQVAASKVLKTLASAKSAVRLLLKTAQETGRGNK